jgi:hypothetical protein
MGGCVSAAVLTPGQHLGREWIVVERDPRMARLTARRLKLGRVQASLPDRRRAAP